MAFRVEDIGHNPNYPLFTPAATSMYVRHCSEQKTANRDDLNWFNPDHPTFSHPAALYSAGYAYLDVRVSKERESMLMQRDRNRTILIADSGGYQIGNSTFPKGEVFRTDIHGRTADKIRSKILAWSEAFADFSMTMDFPTWAIGGPTYIFKSFGDCLSETLYNCSFINENRISGKTRFLNVIQGNNYLEAVKWYNEVKAFDFEGWSFAGQVAANPDVTVKIILHLWRDGNISPNKSWIHILGRSSLPAVWANNIIHRCIRRHCYANAYTSYDSSSPVQFAVNAIDVVGSVFNADQMTLLTAHTDDYKGDAAACCPVVMRNMIAMLDAANMVNSYSEMTIDDLIDSAPIQDVYINFKRDVEKIFLDASEIGIDRYQIEDVNLKTYRKLID
ncbi:hypothetical protein CCP1ISM_40026 [Azospirillaceae bacterium]